MKTVDRTWQALGMPDHTRFSQLRCHLHCEFPAAQQKDLTALEIKFLMDTPAATTIMKTVANAIFLES
jgi:hypothetical protein